MDDYAPLQVVPTSYHYLNASKQNTYQFSTTENFRKLDAFQRVCKRP
jgi:hypothetical protein